MKGVSAACSLSFQRFSLARFTGPWTPAAFPPARGPPLPNVPRAGSTSAALRLLLLLFQPQPTFCFPCWTKQCSGDEQHKPVSVSPQVMLPEDLGFSSLSPGLGTDPLGLLPPLEYAEVEGPTKSGPQAQRGAHWSRPGSTSTPAMGPG